MIIPVKMMNETIMESLERRGLIERLIPSKQDHRLAVAKDEGKGGYLYKSELAFGSHSLINCAIDNSKFKNFAFHPDNEEFLLLGGVEEKDLYLLIAYDDVSTFLHKYHQNGLSEADFICLKCVFNDPRLSFFVMKKNVPHGECALGTGRPATFYVTEGSNLPLNRINIAKLDIELDI